MNAKKRAASFLVEWQEKKEKYHIQTYHGKASWKVGYKFCFFHICILLWFGIALVSHSSLHSFLCFLCRTNRCETILITMNVIGNPWFFTLCKANDNHLNHSFFYSQHFCFFIPCIRGQFIFVQDFIRVNRIKHNSMLVWTLLSVSLTLSLDIRWK